jgi:serine phosphatase RsbU (regulator of sigma subunit)
VLRPRATTSVNSEIFTDLEAMERFVTCFVCAVDARGHPLRWADAGHGFAVLLRGGDVLPLTSEGGGPRLGVLPANEYRLDEIALQPQDEILIFSDGLLERDELARGGEQLTLSARETIQLLLADAPPGAGAQAVLDLLVDDPARPRRPSRDDETVLVIRMAR